MQYAILNLKTDWQISNDTVVRPDVMLVCQELEENVTVTPELIVEVLRNWVIILQENLN